MKECQHSSVKGSHFISSSRELFYNQTQISFFGPVLHLPKKSFLKMLILVQSRQHSVSSSPKPRDFYVEIFNIKRYDSQLLVCCGYHCPQVIFFYLLYNFQTKKWSRVLKILTMKAEENINNLRHKCTCVFVGGHIA